ncbi:hypothetical protein TNCV_120521 [Trichonephila clavipes]|nr:hypothetical protein TNCV_120521 [Trichonephila clavipes]
MLYHLEKGWKAAQSFRDVNDFFDKVTTRANVSVGSGLPVSNQGSGNPVVKVSDLGWRWHEFELSTTKDPPCKVVVRRGGASSGVVLVA